MDREPNCPPGLFVILITSAEITTMLIAGHETTATSMDWLLYDLAKPENQHIQSRLRDELLSVPTDSPTLEELNALPYLDAVLRETLRKNAVVEQTERVALKDCVIPLLHPYVDRYGVERREVTLVAEFKLWSCFVLTPWYLL